MVRKAIVPDSDSEDDAPQTLTKVEAEKQHKAQTITIKEKAVRKAKPTATLFDQELSKEDIKEVKVQQETKQA